MTASHAGRRGKGKAAKGEKGRIDKGRSFSITIEKWANRPASESRENTKDRGGGKDEEPAGHSRYPGPSVPPSLPLRKAASPVSKVGWWGA